MKAHVFVHTEQYGFFKSKKKQMFFDVIDKIKDLKAKWQTFDKLKRSNVFFF